MHAETSDCGRAVSPCELPQEGLVDVRLEIHVTALHILTCITLCKLFSAFNKELTQAQISAANGIEQDGQPLVGR